ncbi:YhgE/Pip domain-containing protein [Paenibacillus silvae]|uniref:YhgE/Pip domain-containing protein n=1 Tax=Paenibacillus silvae TaxID=1325358 RepID=UPI0020030997|nr:YhgE/Pip domain-containing protein [Paenibacillus silvae]MCK6078570.1 YhgE/Pip domain-containing protein [Paenibacillus silvae]MCK6152889.1 YhgE/Pip domain-containing protein [Paenibacillus silvae]MCK6271342.1 YhgE/Pip domain-containing protein [Paenibacillus silvae]
MKSLRVFGQDLKSAFKKPKVFIPILVVLFIPVLYSGLFLNAFWDPYGKMNELPVAVVNTDQGAVYNDKSLEVGQDLVDELKKSDDFNWQFVTREQAEQGMKDNKYYMTIVIPEDFSAKATTLMDEHPEPAELIYEPNEGYNFLAGQIGGTAVKQIRTKVSAKVTESYTESLLDKVGDVSDGLATAGEGADKIHDGASKLDEGAATLKENLAKLADGAGKLQNGTVSLKEGTASLAKGTGDLHTGASTLSSGLAQLAAAGTKLGDGAAQAAAGGKQLHAGVQAAQEGASKLDAGIAATEQGSAKLTAGLQTSVEGSGKVSEGAKAVAQGLAQLAKSSPELAASPAVQQLLAASQAVAAGSEQVYQGGQQLVAGSQQLQAAQQQLHQGSSQLVQGEQQLVQGAAQLSGGQEQLAAGLEQFNAKLNEAAAGGAKLAAGSEQLNAGAGKLLQGVGTLEAGVSTLTDGSQKLADGAGELKEGTVKLTDGSGELATKLNDAAEQTSSVHKTDELVQMYAEPVKVDEHKLNEVPNYGTGFSPYFLSLGLFVGALIATLVVPTRSSSVSEASGWNRFVSKTLAFTIMSGVQSLLASGLVLYGLGLKVQSVPLFLLFSFVTSLTFMYIIQALVTWLENPGRFIAILMLIFQLTTSAGTFPLELIPNWLKVFNPWLPMTYSVTGYKAVISSGEFGVAWDQIGILCLFAILGLAGTLSYFLKHRTAEDNSVSKEAVLQA